MVKYNVDQESTINFEKLQLVQSQFVSNLLIFIYIWSNSEIFGYLAFRFGLFDKWRIGILSLTNIW